MCGNERSVQSYILTYSMFGSGRSRQSYILTYSMFGNERGRQSYIPTYFVFNRRIFFSLEPQQREPAISVTAHTCGIPRGIWAFPRHHWAQGGDSACSGGAVDLDRWGNESGCIWTKAIDDEGDGKRATRDCDGPAGQRAPNVQRIALWHWAVMVMLSRDKQKVKKKLL